MCPIVFLGMMYLAGACNYQCQYCSLTSHRFRLRTNKQLLTRRALKTAQCLACFTMNCLLYCSEYDN